MKAYLVGGAVRDKLLHLPIKEKDWVVVGETQASMLAAGFKQVGKDFPVFLHPTTREEYALARKERKIAKGYHGFEFDTTASVTLEEDLLRRDLTINAIAQDDLGTIIDPYHGLQDLNNKILRHVSPAFVEDPVRILRIARFSARFSDFAVADETKILMKHMVSQGEVDVLVAERVWKEFERAMSEASPERFIEVLDSCGALERLFPLFKHNKNKILSQIKYVKHLTSSTADRIILLLLSINNSKKIKAFCDYYRGQKSIYDMVNLLLKFKNISFDEPKETINFYHELDAFRRPERFEHWLALSKINLSLTKNQANNLHEIFHDIKKIALPADVLTNYRGKAVAEYIESERLKRLEHQFYKINRQGWHKASV